MVLAETGLRLRCRCLVRTQAVVLDPAWFCKLQPPRRMGTPPDSATEDAGSSLSGCEEEDRVSAGPALRIDRLGSRHSCSISAGIHIHGPTRCRPGPSSTGINCEHDGLRRRDVQNDMPSVGCLFRWDSPRESVILHFMSSESCLCRVALAGNGGTSRVKSA